jgi:hypothetical protein
MQTGGSRLCPPTFCAERHSTISIERPLATGNPIPGSASKTGTAGCGSIRSTPPDRLEQSIRAALSMPSRQGAHRCAIVIELTLSRARFGTQLYILSTNPRAARFAGLNNASILLRTYLLSGLLSSVAGLIMMARASSAKDDHEVPPLCSACSLPCWAGWTRTVDREGVQLLP